jgi:hypothetical protein
MSKVSDSVVAAIVSAPFKFGNENLLSSGPCSYCSAVAGGSLMVMPFLVDDGAAVVSSRKTKKCESVISHIREQAFYTVPTYC